MIVDPAEDARRALADHFRARGWDVAVAADGIEAVAHALGHAVDVIVMSTRLPQLHGYEAAAILTRITPRVRVILTVDAAPPATPRRSRNIARIRCFPKPLDLDSLARAIEENGPDAGLGGGPGGEDRP
jgi:CheY-like chemotaxis protein